MKSVVLVWGLFSFVLTLEARELRFHTPTADVIYVQTLNVTPETPHFNWSPGDSICPLHATNAVQLAVDTLTNKIHDVSIDDDRTTLSFFPTIGNKGWVYEVRMWISSAEETMPNRRSRRLSMAVNLDGTISGIEIGSLKELKEKYAWVGKLYRSAEEKEAVRENLRQYQMEVIRSGMAPLPIPLTPEMDAQLVAEGVLPADNVQTNRSRRQSGQGFRKQSSPKEPEPLTPEEQEKKREAISEFLLRYQMVVVMSDMPPMPIPPPGQVEDALVQEGVLGKLSPDTELTDEEKRERSLKAWAYIKSNEAFRQRTIATGLLPDVDVEAELKKMHRNSAQQGGLPPGVIRAQEARQEKLQDLPVEN